MPPLNPHISLTALARIRHIEVPDPLMPYTFLLHCDFHIQKDGLVTIPVLKYFVRGEVPPVGSYVSLDGPFWMVPGTDGSIEPDTFEVVCDNPSVELTLPSPSVTAVGTILSVIGREIFMDVGSYNREAKAVITYQIIITVPDDARRANMRMPDTGANVQVRGILSSIAVHEDHDTPTVEMTNIVFMPRTDFSRKGDTSGLGRTKRRFVPDKLPHTPNPGRSMKKTKSGPIEAFTPEELSSGSSSEASSSQQGTGDSSLPDSVDTSPATVSTTSSQLAAQTSPTPTRFTRSCLKADKVEKHQVPEAGDK
ncbi:hypothetical protein RSOLAG1IB_10731 [Rhizoctonia solani AG-1 IB]|uniref:Uncharacterized protein n=1 Tax=Thanatephorus cucumeris (strain AG1-IB / isolate 7/3/14) TaxID=1108050 RepID=M5C811_THACB|nr:hypothetical protein BN14_09310 [Rhizoctonia solani AG-1 IB]CEL63402.1 hypothetical protein RSOLAG1IB_10731 [Rhizoctonia solani AG-1 IB]